MLTLECDCGYVAVNDQEDGLAEAAQEHAGSSHGIDLSVELILSLALRGGQLSENCETE